MGVEESGTEVQADVLCRLASSRETRRVRAARMRVAAIMVRGG
jgi:hypothetical protein